MMMSSPRLRAAAAVFTVLTIGALAGFLSTKSASAHASSLTQLYAGYNVKTGYAYSLESDCFAQGAAQCPRGSWCNVIARENW